jgi:dihydrofolate reductase
MRKLILKMSVSVDGFVAGPKGEIDWLFNSMDEGATAWVLDTIRQVGLHIMGSHTFYDMACYWPYSSEPFAAPMNEIPKAVFSRSGSIKPISKELTSQALKDAAVRHADKLTTTPSDLQSWTDAYVGGGDLAAEIARLKQQPGKDILAHGGAGFAQSLARLDLIDEYRLLTHPVVLGTGLSLFSAIPKPMVLTLLNTTAFDSGAVAHVYRPARN